MGTQRKALGSLLHGSRLLETPYARQVVVSKSIADTQNAGGCATHGRGRLRRRRCVHERLQLVVERVARLGCGPPRPSRSASSCRPSRSTSPSSRRRRGTPSSSSRRRSSSSSSASAFGSSGRVFTEDATQSAEQRLASSVDRDKRSTLAVDSTVGLAREGNRNVGDLDGLALRTKSTSKVEESAPRERGLKLPG